MVSNVVNCNGSNQSTHTHSSFIAANKINLLFKCRLRGVMLLKETNAEERTASLGVLW